MTLNDVFSPMRTHAAIVMFAFALFLFNVLGIVEFPASLNQALRLRSGGIDRDLLGADFMSFLGVGVVLALILPRLDPVRASLVTLLAAIPPFYVEYSRPGVAVLVPMEYTLLMILVLFSINVLIKYFNDTHDRQKIISMFGQYVPPEVVRGISKAPETFSLQGESRELTVLFCDIRRFSAISEQLDSRQLAQLLNLYFTDLTDVLHRTGATIDKYMGDAIMAFWGAPLAQPDHASRAVDAALAMVDALEPLNAKFRRHKLPPIEIGIGLNTGVMNVGNMGSRYRVAYTVVGDAVNLGARLEGLTRIYDAKIVVSESTKAANPAIAFRELDHVRVKGKGEATRIFEPVGSLADLGAEQHDWLARHESALNAYYAGDFTEAETLFDELDHDAGDSRYYHFMRNRVITLKSDRRIRFNGITNYNPEMSIGTS